jgi:peptidoglycan hydrolase-like protein with peptidoglycan-binding domain
MFLGFVRSHSLTSLIVIIAVVGTGRIATPIEIAQTPDPFESAPAPRVKIDPEAERRAREEQQRAAESKRLEDAEAVLGLTTDQRRQVQDWLVALGHLQKIGDGSFDAATRAGIKSYQRARNVIETGYLNTFSFFWLASDGSAALVAAEALQRAREQDAQKKAEELRGAAELKRLGDAENALRLSTEQRHQVQGWLVALGLMPKAGDGSLDGPTRDAIRAFQRGRADAETGYLNRPILDALAKEGLAAIAAADAARRIQEAEAQRKAAEEAKKAEEARIAAETKRLEDAEGSLSLSLEQRRQVQGWLVALGHLPTLGDGTFDAETRSAIKSYQRARKVGDTGFLNGSIFLSLVTDGQSAMTGAEAARRAQEQEAQRRAVEAERKRIEDQENVLRLAPEQRRQIQTWLVALGHLQRATDGTLDATTRAAIKAYQLKTGEAETGYLTASVYEALSKGGQAAIALAEEQRKSAELKRLQDGENELRLTPDQWRQVQVWLATLGHLPTASGDELDQAVRSAIRAYQRAKKEMETSYLSRALMTTLTIDGQAAVARAEFMKRAQEQEAQRRAAEVERKRIEEQENALSLTPGQRRQIQTWLVALGHLQRATDGTLDATTREAIKAYQRQVIEAETGYLTTSVFEALSKGGQAAIALAEEQRKAAELKRLQDGENELRLTAEQRRQVQTWLAALGHLPAVSGDEFDAAARNGVKAYQRVKKETETGYMSRTLLTALTREGQTAIATAEAAKRAQEQEAQRRLAEEGENSLGLTPEQRRQAQAWLVALGHLPRAGIGPFDTGTRTAIRALQRARKEAETGYLTAAQLRDLAKEGPAAIAAAEADRRVQEIEAHKRAAQAERKAEEQRLAAGQQRTQELKRLEDGEAALRLTAEQQRQIQTWLVALGHLPKAGDGSLDTPTRDAIKAYQRTRQETETGYLTQALMIALQSDGQKTLTPPIVQAQPPVAQIPSLSTEPSFPFDGVWILVASRCSVASGFEPYIRLHVDRSTAGSFWDGAKNTMDFNDFRGRAVFSKEGTFRYNFTFIDGKAGRVEGKVTGNNMSITYDGGGVNRCTYVGQRG